MFNYRNIPQPNAVASDAYDSSALGLRKQGDGAIARSPRDRNACREILVRLLLLRVIAAGSGIPIEKRGVELPDGIFVRGLNQLLIGIHINISLRLWS